MERGWWMPQVPWVQKIHLIQFNHSLSQGRKFITCNYLEKVNQKKDYVYYKLGNRETFVSPNQIFCPTVCVSEKLKLTVSDYQILSGMIQ